MLCADEVKKDITDLATVVPAIHDVFNIVEKIGAGILTVSLPVFCFCSNFGNCNHISLILCMILLYSDIQS